jgi:ribosome-associated translation inhibitor RaiA
MSEPDRQATVGSGLDGGAPHPHVEYRPTEMLAERSWRAGKEAQMNMPIEIHFHDIERSEALEALIQERAEGLVKRFDRLTHCRVFVEATSRHSHRGTLAEVRIDLGIPARRPIVVRSETDLSDPQRDIAHALRETFAAARRRLDEAADQMKGRVRAERGRRKPARSDDRPTADRG